ncbi:MAG: L-aspartate oxidase [Actinobacteria bacterium]|uniref:L-aspartate oxidase n=1 Tax=freshwater metagenome TaxID=449393 RepID=A0A6J7UFU2_9ZZZZ|nr:L-aspartate oxidase [Actinomycetota bacterium]MSY23093.1 L-aspartate oxidase [Actinomycetota bacterium]MTA73657.1 L-aspartate oxidase [Actinomycetota bacterium]
MTPAPLDLLVLGSGVAGLSAAVRAAGTHGLRTGVITKGGLDLATTRWAQGGVAAALSGNVEEIDLHLADTLAAGAGLCDFDAVRVLVDEGPRRVEELIALGAEFDRDERGNLELAREGGHSVARVVHAGGAATGAEIERALVAAVRRTAAVLHEHTFALDLMIEDGCCVGVQAIDPNGQVTQVRARNVLLATGGAGQLFAITTNPSVATGDGVAMALRAGVAIADLEFFQFHPTALYHPGIPRPLLSEALRGHGALLRDSAGERFVDEMLPRDVVSRAILAEMLEQHTDHVWLDATGLDHFAERFPTIYSDLVASGLDPMTDWLPVAPAAHHQCGGIVTDLFGATSMPGLWAAGETACSGVHGANRLASNSLLEGMVFGPRAIESIASGAFGPSATGAMRSVLGFAESDDPTLSILGVALPLPETSTAEETSTADVTGTPVTNPQAGSSSVTPQSLKRGLQQAMSTDAGVQRSAETLHRAALVIAQVMAELAPMDQQEVAVAEVQNLAQIAQTLVAAALARTESRGTHARLDYPSLDPAQAHRLVVGG